MVMQAHGFVWAFAVSAAFAGSSTIVSLALPETRLPMPCRRRP